MNPDKNIYSNSKILEGGVPITPSSSDPTKAVVPVGNADGTPVGGGTQYTDGNAAPTNPIGNQLIFNDSGTERAVSNAKPLPVLLASGLAGENTANNWLEVTPGVKGLRVKRTFDWSGAVGATAIWTPASNKKFVITDIEISVSAACVVTLVDGNSGTDTVGNATTEGSRVGKYNLAANGGVEKNNQGYYSLAANNSLYIITSAAGGSIAVFGYEI